MVEYLYLSVVDMDDTNRETMLKSIKRWIGVRLKKLLKPFLAKWLTLVIVTDQRIAYLSNNNYHYC